MERDLAEAAAGLQKFLAASDRKDMEGMKACLTRESVTVFHGQAPEDVKFELGEPHWEEDKNEVVIIPLKGVPKDGAAAGGAGVPPGGGGMEMPCFMVKEEGQWKFNLARTMEAMMGGMEKAMKAAVEQLGTVMAGVTEKLGDAMKEAFEGTSTEGDEDNDNDKDEDEDKEEDEAEDAVEEAETAYGAAGEKELNDRNFQMAVENLKGNEEMWGMQIEMAVGHKVRFELDFDSLGGRYELVQPFIHQGMSAVVGAFPEMMVRDRESYGEFFKGLNKVKVHGAEGGTVVAKLTNGILDVTVPLQQRDVRPPTGKVVDAIRRMLKLPALLVEEEEAVLSSPAHSQAVPEEDQYAYAEKFVLELEAAMKAAEMWPGEKPAGEIEVKGAFGSENMAFEQWLAWVFIERVKEIVAERGEFPRHSQVAAYAVREFDGRDCGEVLQLLSEFDEKVNQWGEN